jgi:predicted dehydrogenase
MTKDTPVYKCAIIGVGPNRSRGLAEAYQHIERGSLVAAAARTPEHLSDFSDEFDVPKRYADYREMFAREKPDLVHVNTPPSVRLEVMEAAHESGVGALIIEKPLAIDAEDYREIHAFAQRHPLKVSINHQLHFQPRRYELQQRVADGQIGDVRCVDASCGMNLASQGTHTLQAIGAFLPGQSPTQVFGQVSGAQGLADTPRQHFAPDSASAVISFDSGIQAVLQSGEMAPAFGRDGLHTHKRVAVYGTRGFVHWTMWSWEIGVEGRIESGVHEYPDEDILGQARMTEAMFDWMEDDNAVHPLCLQQALVEFNTVLGIYISALERRPVALPCDPAGHLIERLRSDLV